MSAYTFTIKDSDQRPPIKAKFYTSKGEVIDLSEAEEVTFTMTNQRNKQIVVDKQECNLYEDENSVSSIATYFWKPGDVEQAGTFLGEFTINWGQSIKQTFPDQDYITIIIGKKL